MTSAPETPVSPYIAEALRRIATGVRVYMSDESISVGYTGYIGGRVGQWTIFDLSEMPEATERYLELCEKTRARP